MAAQGSAVMAPASQEVVWTCLFQSPGWIPGERKGRGATMHPVFGFCGVTIHGSVV